MLDIDISRSNILPSELVKSIQQMFVHIVKLYIVDIWTRCLTIAGRTVLKLLHHDVQLVPQQRLKFTPWKPAMIIKSILW